MFTQDDLFLKDSNTVGEMLYYCCFKNKDNFLWKYMPERPAFTLLNFTLPNLKGHDILNCFSPITQLIASNTLLTLYKMMGVRAVIHGD